MRALKSFAAITLPLVFLASCAFAQSQSVEMQVTLLWANGHHRLSQNDDAELGLPGAATNSQGSGGEALSGNSVSNMDIRISVIGDAGSTVAEDSPDSEGMAKFIVVGSFTNPTTGSRSFPVYRIRVRGSNIEEQFLENVQPGLGDRMVTIELHKKGEKKGAGGGIVSANTLKIPHKAEKEFEKGQKALGKKKLAEALAHFQKSIAIYPSYDAAYNAMGVALRMAGDNAGGQKAFEKAIAINDKFALAYVNLARVLGSQKKFEEAAGYLSRSLSVEPLNPDALSMLCQFDVIRGKYDDVPALAQKLHSIAHDGQALCHYAAGNALEHLNRSAEAIYEYMLFMKEDPTSNLSANARESVDRLRQQLNQAKAE